MSPKKSGRKLAAKKTAPRKAAAKPRAPKAPSPMRKIEHSSGRNPDGLADQARAAHELPRETPARATDSRAARGVATETSPQPPTPPATPPVDAGQE